MKLGIVIAMPNEAKCFRKGKLPLQEVIQINERTNIYICGIGKEFASDGTKELIFSGVTHLLSWGFAGGLNKAFNSGDIILASSVHNGETDIHISSDWLSEQIPKEISNDWKQGRLLSNMHMLSSPEEKQLWQKKTDSSVVDMESYAVKELALENGLPFAAIRFVIDTANMSLPKVVIEHTDNFGKPNIFKLIAACVSKPKTIKELIQLGFAANKAQKQMRLTSQILIQNLYADHV